MAAFGRPPHRAEEREFAMERPKGYQKGSRIDQKGAKMETKTEPRSSKGAPAEQDRTKIEKHMFRRIPFGCMFVPKSVKMHSKIH
jgi:hypothetical protein